MIAVLEAYRAGAMGRDTWLKNIVAGLIVGVVALPLSMAFAIASGARPENGLYTAIVAGLCVSLFGGSRLQIAGPTGAFIVILSGITAKYGLSGLQLATMMAGCMLLLMGFLRLGTLVKFIPLPVIVGFTTGIGLIIWTGQWKEFFGLPAPKGEHFHQKIVELIASFPQLHLPTTLISIGSLALLIVLPKIKLMKRIPPPLFVLVIATVVQAVFQFPGVATLGSTFHGIPQTPPTFAFPHVTLARLQEMLFPAFTIAMLGAIESLLCAVVADTMAGTKHQSNQELIGQGIANVVSPLFGGIAATGAIARTATSVRNGATNPIAGIVHALTLILIIAFLAPQADDVPLAVLAAILFIVAYNMSDLKHFMHVVRVAPKSDVVTLLVTFLLTVFTDLVVAVEVGIVIAMIAALRRIALTVGVRRFHPAREAHEIAIPDHVMIYEIAGPFFFAAIETFANAIVSHDTEPKVIIIRMLQVPFIDISGIDALQKSITLLHRDHIRVMVCEANTLVLGRLRKAHFLEFLGEHNYATNLNDAIASAQMPIAPELQVGLV